jgi:hypothetical protein
MRGNVLRYGRESFIGSNTSLAVLTGHFVAYRFLATEGKTPAAISIYCASVTIPGSFRLNIETCNSSGKPSNILFDANATIVFTPVQGVNTITFPPILTQFIKNEVYYITLEAIAASQIFIAFIANNSSPQVCGFGINAMYASSTGRSGIATVTQYSGGGTGFGILCLDGKYMASDCMFPGTVYARSTPINTSGSFVVVALEFGVDFDILVSGISVYCTRSSGAMQDYERMRLINVSNPDLPLFDFFMDRQYMDYAINNRSGYIHVPLDTLHLPKGTYKLVLTTNQTTANALGIAKGIYFSSDFDRHPKLYTGTTDVENVMPLNWTTSNNYGEVLFNVSEFLPKSSGVAPIKNKLLSIGVM